MSLIASLTLDTPRPHTPPTKGLPSSLRQPTPQIACTGAMDPSRYGDVSALTLSLQVTSSPVIRRLSGGRKRPNPASSD
jgi:hypothetical protein